MSFNFLFVIDFQFHAIVVGEDALYDFNLFKKIFKDFVYLFSEKGKGGRKRGRELSMYKRYIDRLPLACLKLGTWPATQARALTGN